MNLTDRLGFEADLNLQTGEISFGEVKPGLIRQRTLSDMYPVLAQTNPIISPGLEGILNPENDGALVHWLLRSIGDTPEIEASGLKLDVTVILPTPFGPEFPKTTGHYHLPLADGTRTPDFYQVVHGEGVIMLQREDMPGINAYVVRPEIMQHIVIPPWMGHLTINTGDVPLVFANICTRGPHLDYRPYLDRHGAAYYLLNRNGVETFIPNPAYKNVPPLEELSPNGSMGLDNPELSFYPILRDSPQKLRFLTHPSEYLDRFKHSLKKSPKR